MTPGEVPKDAAGAGRRTDHRQDTTGPRESALAPAARRPVAWLFDLDGVVTDTAVLHAQAWRTAFDRFLSSRDRPLEDPAGRPFDPVADYEAYVDGKPHADGVRDFLASRGVVVPEGAPSDAPGSPTVSGIAMAKNSLYLASLATQGVQVFAGTLEFLDAVRRAGRRTAIVSASENCSAVLNAGGVAGRFDVQVDGIVAKAHGLRGKPAPDTFLFAAARLETEAADAAVVEDAPAGVAAGRAGGFGLVVGVARRASPDDLRTAGADLVVGDLSELLDRPAAGSEAALPT